MKTSSKCILGWGAALALVAGFASASFAGPSPQFWQRNNVRPDRAKAKVTVAAPAAKTAEASAMGCPACKTTKVEEFSALNPSGKIAPRYTTIGAKHECSACGGGAVTIVRGKVTNEMKGDCPVCAKAKAANAGCCNATS